MMTSTGGLVDRTITKCNSLTPCANVGVYLIVYHDIKAYGADKDLGGPGTIIYGSCERHIDNMRLGCGDLVYVSDSHV